MYLNLLIQSAMAAFALFAFAALSPALAQSETQKVTATAAKPAAIEYRSELENYQRYSESTIKPWRQANDTVKDIGGWRAYAREMTQGTTQEPELSKSSQDSKHGGHK